MTNDIKKLVERIQSQKSDKPAPVPIKTVIPKEVPPIEEDEDLLDEQEEIAMEEPAPQEEATQTTETPDTRTVIAQEIERMQNSGIFRTELIYQLIEMNDNLKVIAHILHKSLGGEADGK